MNFKSIGVSRHKLGTDGIGVTSLVGGFGCPLDCKYCLNPQCKWSEAERILDIEVLHEQLSIDSLYFEATGGGVTFGGGEPLLQAEFIADFIRYCRGKGAAWRFSVESCLAVDESAVTAVLGLVDEYIVDIKDMNDEIYRAYTGKSNERLKRNLKTLAANPDSVTLRLPLIPDYNTISDVLASETELRDMGFYKFHRFNYIKDPKKRRNLAK